MAIVIRRQLDVQGQACPAPVRAAAAAVADMSPGELVEILASDPRAVRDFALWARATGNDLLESSQFGNVFRFVVRKRSAGAAIWPPGPVI